MRFFSYILAVLFLFAFRNVEAQNMEFGVSCGVGISKPHDFNTFVPLKIGGYAKFEFPSGIFLSTGAGLARKGWNCDVYSLGSGGQEKKDWVCNVYYINVPVAVGYGILVNEKFSLFMKGGPYLDVGVAGNSKIRGVDNIGPPAKSGNVFSDGLWRRVDWGFDFSLGTIIKRKIGLTCTYSLGLGDNPKGGWSLLSGKTNRAMYIELSYAL